MELCTVGRQFYPNYRMLLWHTRSQALAKLGHNTHFRLLWIESGTGILRLGTHRETFIAPTLFCLNELELPALEQSIDVQGQALYFHPNVVNSALTFENVRHPSSGMTTTEVQDRHWLRPFVERDGVYHGQLPVGPIIAQRISGLYQSIEQELAAQRDRFWPCRSRSLLLEILFMLDQLYATPCDDPSLAVTDAAADTADDIDPVILYLHTHYQDRITIDELTRAFHTNRTTLTERFRRATDTSVVSYLIRLRVRLAALMLRDTQLPIGEVMDRVGFRDSTHFGRTFRKHVGCTPSAYRERFL